ncbi:MAG: nitrite reductase small subunit NirD [Proteobacteria bacterium]|nr:nitrite reductase small subunit NirD [Pseudomonadota bacterium]
MNTHVKIPAWIDVGAVSDVPRRGARRVPSPRGDIAIFRTGDGEVFALLDKCPHKGGPLSEGIVHGRAVTCPLHAWNIDLATGEAMGADKGKGCAPVIALRVEDGRLMLSLDGTL